MSGRTVIVAIAVVLAMGLTFAGGYVLGRGDRVTVPDLFGLGRHRSLEAEPHLALGQRAERAAYVVLRKADLRLGRLRFYVCGGRATRGIIVKQFPPSGVDIPVKSAVDIWVAYPEGSFLGSGNPPCRHPQGG
jgi:hypothetical protein